MLFHLSRYDFRLPRYRRVKQRVIFDRLPSPSLSLTRISRSHLASLTYPKVQTSDRRDSWKTHFPGRINRSLDSATIHSLYPKRYGYFESLYLGNELRYRDNSKSGFNGMLFSISWVGFDNKIFNSLLYTFYKKSQTREWNDLYKDLNILANDQNKLRSTFRNNKKLTSYVTYIKDIDTE